MSCASRLRHRVKIQEVTETRSATGGVVQAWAVSGKRWASIEPLKGRELFAAQAVDNDISHRVRLRFVDWLTPKHRFQHGSTNRVLNIASVINVDERGKETVCMCKEDV